MQTYDLAEAQARLAELVAAAADGESFLIAQGGTLLVKVMPVRKPQFGFLAGQVQVPEDFDRMDQRTIRRLFDGKP